MQLDAELVRQNRELRESLEAAQARNRKLAEEHRRMKEAAGEAAHQGGNMALMGREAMIGAYLVLKEDKRRAAARMEEIRQSLMEDFGDCESKTYGRYKVAARPKTRRTFDRGAFAEAHPDMDLGPFFKEKMERSLAVKEIEQ